VGRVFFLILEQLVYKKKNCYELGRAQYRTNNGRTTYSDDDTAGTVIDCDDTTGIVIVVLGSSVIGKILHPPRNECDKM